LVTLFDSGYYFIIYGKSDEQTISIVIVSNC